MDIELSLIIESRIYREVISSHLNSSKGIKVANTYSSSKQAIRTIDQCFTDIAIIDGSINDVLLLITTIKEVQPLTKIVLITSCFGMTLSGEYIALGVEGIITNSDGVDDLKNCIATVHSGHLCYPKEIANLFRSNISSVREIGTQIYDGRPVLTRRQSIVMQLIAIGLSNKEIARRLNIEVSTVKNHVHQILERMHVKSRSEAVARYSVNGHPSH
ncbi:response regulator transcription factor [Paraglaciecola sp. L1A13]|uniref:helix-turn-helix transcriptional regulator n=1 Tax=Paraglaciecola sp. L1A13 TaxID=2686359 RepID=UPI00131DDA16|nr:response regulator transcription factor [Paraglaciecola sp. L1A13]|tara:strand:+ start:430 stop:1077 length:648 start_codon:yes stop_codon:yes gene_type:complete